MNKNPTPFGNGMMGLMKIIYWALMVYIPIYFIIGFQLFKAVVVDRYFGDNIPLPVYLTAFGLIASIGINIILKLMFYAHSYFKTISDVDDFKRYHDLVKEYEVLNDYRMAVEFSKREIMVRDLRKFESYVRKHAKNTILKR